MLVPVEPFSPFDKEKHRRFHVLLSERCAIGADGLQARLQNVASVYRHRLMNQALDRSRKADRAANAKVAKLATLAADGLDTLAFSNGLDDLPLIPPLPHLSGRQAWLNALALVIKRLSNRLHVREDQSSIQLAAVLTSVASEIADLDIEAVRHPLFNLSPSTLAADEAKWSGRLSDSLRILAVAAETSRMQWVATRGPEPNSAMTLLAADLYASIRDARGEPLKLLIQIDGQYNGEPQNADTRFMLEFVSWVHDSISEEIRKKDPNSFKARAVFQAYKLHSETVNLSRKKLTA